MAGIPPTASEGNKKINNSISTIAKAPTTTTSDTNTEGQDVDASHKGQLSSCSISGTIQSTTDIASATSTEDITSGNIANASNTRSTDSKSLYNDLSESLLNFNATAVTLY